MVTGQFAPSQLSRRWLANFLFLLVYLHQQKNCQKLRVKRNEIFKGMLGVMWSMLISSNISYVLRKSSPNNIQNKKLFLCSVNWEKFYFEDKQENNIIAINSCVSLFLFQMNRESFINNSFFKTISSQDRLTEGV